MWPYQAVNPAGFYRVPERTGFEPGIPATLDVPIPEAPFHVPSKAGPLTLRNTTETRQLGDSLMERRSQRLLLSLAWMKT
jgi:hypothetical protein